MNPLSNAVSKYFDRPVSKVEKDKILKQCENHNINHSSWQVLAALDLEQSRKAYLVPNGFVAAPYILLDRVRRATGTPGKSEAWRQIVANLENPVSEEDNGWKRKDVVNQAMQAGFSKALPSFWPRGYGSLWLQIYRVPGAAENIEGFPNLKTLKAAFEDGIGLLFAYKHILPKITEDRSEQSEILFRAHGPNALWYVSRVTRMRDVYRDGAQALDLLVRGSTTKEQNLLWRHSVQLV